jgi:hypothetical protein
MIVAVEISGVHLPGFSEQVNDPSLGSAPYVTQFENHNKGNKTRHAYGFRVLKLLQSLNASIESR